MLFAGTMIAPGIAFGPAVVWNPGDQKVQVRRIARAEIGDELHRLDHALRCAHEELESIVVRVLASVGKSAAAIFRAHQFLLADEAFTSPIRNAIEEDHVSAETAVSTTVEEFARRIAAIPNQYFAARSEDFTDLGRRLLIHLGKKDQGRTLAVTTPGVLIAENLSAADVVALDRTQLLALIMTQSGSNSHAALLAATLGVPVIGGVPQLWGQVRGGDTVIVDGNHGHVVVRPTELATRQYRTRREIFERFCGEVASLRDVPAETVDGRRVRLTANVGVAEDVPRALAKGAEGIGLVRTEYFLLTQSDPASEEEQYRFYASIVDQMSPRPVTFRTFDLGGDKGSHGPATPETNPMLGCRGIRLLHERQELFINQMRALLRSSQHGPIRIMFPLITSLTEFQDTMLWVRGVKKGLHTDGIGFDEKVPFGCMVETPAAATIPDLLAREVEFFSIGSNDLIQYTLATDRTNPRVASIYEPLHLAILRMMRAVTLAARARNRSVSLCGEMAADPIYTIILLGLGVDELSMNPVMIPAVKQIIRGINWAEARDIAKGVLREHRAKDVQACLETIMAKRFPQVMSIYGHEEVLVSCEKE